MIVVTQENPGGSSRRYGSAHVAAERAQPGVQVADLGRGSRSATLRIAHFAGTRNSLWCPPHGAGADRPGRTSALPSSYCDELGDPLVRVGHVARRSTPRSGRGPPRCRSAAPSRTRRCAGTACSRIAGAAAGAAGAASERVVGGLRRRWPAARSWGGVDPPGRGGPARLPPAGSGARPSCRTHDLAVVLHRAAALAGAGRAEGLGLPVLEAMVGRRPGGHLGRAGRWSRSAVVAPARRGTRGRPRRAGRALAAGRPGRAGPVGGSRGGTGPATTPGPRPLASLWALYSDLAT